MVQSFLWQIYAVQSKTTRTRFYDRVQLWWRDGFNRDVKILKDLDGEIHGKDVLVVEDIIDSGNTLSKVVEMLKTRNPNSIELCTLVSKPSRREIDLSKILRF